MTKSVTPSLKPSLVRRLPPQRRIRRGPKPAELADFATSGQLVVSDELVVITGAGTDAGRAGCSLNSAKHKLIFRLPRLQRRQVKDGAATRSCNKPQQTQAATRTNSKPPVFWRLRLQRGPRRKGYRV
jgi:predicted RecA/RadA family phage recombinase